MQRRAHLALPAPPVERALLRAARVLATQYGHRLGVARRVGKGYALTCAHCRTEGLVWYDRTGNRPLGVATLFLLPCPAQEAVDD